MKAIKLSLGLMALTVTVSAFALVGFNRTPLPNNHPLVGVWRLDVPGSACYEMYSMRTDGTMQVISATQVVESEFAVGRQPQNGFYEWKDHILQENGQPDCMGHVMEVGQGAAHYITFHESGNQFLMCEKSNLSRCIGPFVRQEGI